MINDAINSSLDPDDAKEFQAYLDSNREGDKWRSRCVEYMKQIDDLASRQARLLVRLEELIKQKNIVLICWEKFK